MAPWVLKMFYKWIGKKLIKFIKYKIDLKKIDKYVNKPNELDKQIKQMQKTLNKYGKYIEEIEKDIAQVKSVAHEPVNWSKKIKRIEKKLKLFK